MESATIIWTALPNGMKDGKMRVSVVVSPRLFTSTSNATLQLFSDIVNWPRLVFFAEFSIQFVPIGDPGNVIHPLKTTVLRTDLNTDLYKTLFPVTLPVVPFTPNRLDNRTLRSYPVHDLSQHLEATYRNVASPDPNDLGSLRQVPQAQVVNKPQNFGPLAEAARSQNQAKQQVDTILAGKKVIGPTDAPGLDQQIAQVQSFHASDAPGGAAKQTSAPVKDFHQTVASLSDYPEILRQLGLIIDLECDVPANLPAQGRVTVIPHLVFSDPNVQTTTLKPRTEYQFLASDNQFIARTDPNKGEMEGGFLRLGDCNLAPQVPNATIPQFTITQLDTGAETLRSLDFAARIQDVLAATPSGSMPPPTLRSAGITVAHNGLAPRMQQDFMQHARWESAFQQSAGDDLVVLCANDLTRGYRVDVFDTVDNQWRSLCRRTGTYRFQRSGNAPQSLTISDQEGAVLVSASEPITPAEGEFPDVLRIHEGLFTWQNWSLCVPRPGNGLLPDGTVGAGNDAATNEPFVAQFVPVARSLPRLRFGRSYKLRARICDIAGNGPALEAPNAPIAETPTFVYGRYEPVSPPVLLPRVSIDAKVSPGEAVDRLVIRSEGGAVPPSAPAGTPVGGAAVGGPCERHIVPPSTSQMMAELHGLFDTDNGRLDVAAHARITARQTPLPDFKDVDLFDTAQYLSDPLAKGAAFLGLPGFASSTELKTIDFVSGNDPLATKAFRLKLMPAPSGNQTLAPAFDTTNRVLTVTIKPGTIQKIQMNSLLTADALDKMGVWHLITSPKPPNIDDLRSIATTGGHWMLTPTREITLVHAVARPLEAPVIRTLTPSRPANQTRATLTGVIELDGKSSGHLDLEARWDDIVEDTTQPQGIRSVPNLAHALDLVIDASQNSVSLTASSTDGVSGATVQEFHDTKRRTLRYQAVASSRFKEYFDPQRDFTEASEEYTVDLKSSARPLTPQIRYLVPTFSWQPVETIPNRSITRKRLGYGVRVYMDGPWYSSGEGELLGVVLSRETHFEQIPLTDYPYVTQWANDAIRNAQPIASGPDQGILINSFPLALAGDINNSLVLPELQRPVAVAGHTPQFDADRKLWYCDIEINVGSAYFPFIRLALARYQPVSEEGMWLSPVVQADSVQLVPNRTASIRFDPTDPRQAIVTLSGETTGTDVSTVQAQVYVDVQIETRTSDADIWMPDGDAVPLLATPQGDAIGWEGVVTLPEASTSKRRLTLREFEKYIEDGQANGQSAPTHKRLVYADSFLLP